MKRILFVFNGKAGHAQIQNQLYEIVHFFNERGFFVNCMATQYPRHATELIASYGKDYDFVLVSGGDGTLNEAVNGMERSEKKVPLAYLPTGTTNDCRSNLNIPKDLKLALNRIAMCDTFAMDIGKLNQQNFVYVAAFGTPTKVTYTTSQGVKNVIGYAAYVVEVLKLLPSMRSYHLRITSEGETREGDYLFGLVTNSFSVSGFKGVTGKDVSLNDGRFEMLLVKNTVRVPELLPKLPQLFQDNIDPRYFERFKTSSLKIVSEESVDWCIDGEFGGSLKEADITVLPKEITFYV